MLDINNLFYNHWGKISKILQIQIYNYYLLWYSSEGLFLYAVYKYLKTRSLVVLLTLIVVVRNCGVETIISSTLFYI